MLRSRLSAALLAGLIALGAAACNGGPDPGSQQLETGTDTGSTGDGFEETDSYSDE